MNTMTIPMMGADQAGPAREMLAALKARSAKLGPLAAIVLLHLVLFYLLQSGMLRKVAHAALPEIINISFVAAPTPPKPAPTPKTVPVARQAPAIIPPLPVAVRVPSEPAITVPQAQAVAETPSTVIAPAAPAAPAPTPVAVPAAPRTISSVEYLRAPQPVYPAISRRLGETGTVVLRILIGEKGLPEQVLVQKSSGSANLDEAGRQAALRALFKPHMEDGKPVPVFALVPLNFQLS